MTDIIWIISSCALILAVIAIRAIFGKRMSAGLRYALWGVVLIRLLIPGTLFSSPVSVSTAAHRTEIVQNVEAVKGYSAIARTDAGAVIGRPSASAPKAPSKPQTGEQTPPETRVILNEAAPERFVRMQKTLETRDILNIVWYTGMGLSALYFIAANLRFYLKLRAKRERLSVDIGCPVYTVEGLTSSCLFLNSIYVSKETADDDEALRFVLAHECAHRRHGDSFIALLRTAALILHWYNPLVWAAAFLSRRDSELFADAGAIAALGEDEREHYGRVLIELASGAKTYAPIACAATMMTSGKAELKSRVRGIANRKRMGFLIGAAVLLLAAAAVFCTFCGEQKKENAGGPYPMYEGEAPKAIGVTATIPDTPPYTPYICDIDRDGREDTVRLETTAGEEGSKKVTVTLGRAPGKEYTFVQDGVESSALYLIDCDTTDLRADIVFVYLTKQDELRFTMFRVSEDGKNVNKFEPDPSVRIVMNDMANDPKAGFDANKGIPVTVRDAEDETKIWFTRLTLTNDGFRMLIPLQAEIDIEVGKPIEKSGSVFITFYKEPAPEGAALKGEPFQNDGYSSYTASASESARIISAVNSVTGWTNDNIVDRMEFTFAGQFRIRSGDGVFYFTGDGVVYTHRDGAYYFGQMAEEDAAFLMGLRSKAEAIPDAISGAYDPHDYTALVSFLNTEDENGVPNGKKLFGKYDPADPRTWMEPEFQNERGVMWDHDGRITEIDLLDRPEADFPVLCGQLDLTGLTALKTVKLDGIAYESLYAADCPSLDLIGLYEAASGPVEIRLETVAEEFYAASYTYVGFAGRIGDGGDIRTVELATEGNGYADLYLFITPEGEHNLSINAIPDPGYQFMGWYDEAGKLFSEGDRLVFTDAELSHSSVLALRAVFADQTDPMPMYEGDAPRASAMIASIPDSAPYTPYTCDLDFDGKEDTVLLESIPTFGDDELDGRRITVTLGSQPGETFVFEEDLVYSCELYVIDCDTEDSRLDLIFNCNREDWYVKFFGLRVSADGNSVKRYYPGWTSELLALNDDPSRDPTGGFDAENGIPVLVRTEILDTQYLPTRITLTDEGFKILELMRYEEPTGFNHGWRELKRDMTVMLTSPRADADVINCPAGTKLLPYLTDGWSYVLFKTEDGTIVRKDIEMIGSDVYIDGSPQDEFFEIWTAG